jgi:hypothetical protein
MLSIAPSRAPRTMRPRPSPNHVRNSRRSCTSGDTAADAEIDACNKIIALKAFSGEQLATIHFWRAAGCNKKGHYSKVIADTTDALRLTPVQALYNDKQAPWSNSSLVGEVYLAAK